METVAEFNKLQMKNIFHIKKIMLQIKKHMNTMKATNHTTQQQNTPTTDEPAQMIY